MFNIGPWELMVLAFIGVVVLGPERLPGLARDAAAMLRQLRDLATGARTQLKDELGEFSDLDLQPLRDLRSLNPKVALTRVLLGDDEEDEAAAAAKPAEPAASATATTAATAEPPVSITKPVSAPPPAQQPLGRNEKAPFDADAT